MDKILKKLDLKGEQFVGLIGLIGIIIITANAFCRFVLEVSMSWSDEFLRTIMIYGYFIGAGLTFCHNDCMRLEILDNAFKAHPVGHHILDTIVNIVNLAFFGIMSYFVFQMVFQYIINGTTQSTSKTPAWILTFGCALGMLIIAIASLFLCIKNIVALQHCRSSKK